MKFDESNGSQVEQLPIDVGDKDPSEAILDLPIGKIRPTEVKESTSSVQVEASTSRQDEPHQPPSPPRRENDNVNNEEGKKKKR